jgi:signal transduction histidine kinase
MMSITTYRGRLVIIYSLSTFIMMLVLFSTFYYLTTGSIRMFTDNILLQTAKERISDFRENPDKYMTNEVIEIFGKNYFKIIKTETGTLLKTFEVIQDEVNTERLDFFKEVRQKGHIYETINTPEGNYRSLFISADEKNIIRLILPVSAQEALLGHARNFYVGIMGVSPFLSFVVGWILADRAVRPVIKITENAHAISNGSIKDRLNIKYEGIEFSNLSLVFNSVLDRIERFTENQRQFIADVSHEIRSPLTAIKGNIEVTMRRNRRPDEYEETLKNNLEEIDRIIRILNNFIFLSKADTGGIELNLGEFDISRLLERIIMNKKPLISNKGLDIETKMTQRNGKIFINVAGAQKGLNVSFKDTGVGISSNETEKIFRRFYRVRKNLNMHETGSGLGLYLCRWIAEAHGGTITVTSESGKGSTFNVYLPSNKVVLP